MQRLVFLSLIYFLSAYAAQAQTIDILWQGNGYTPPFYQGRSLWAKQTSITFLALPQGLGNPANLDYVWSKNGTILGNISGIGRNTLTLDDTIFSKPVTIKVEIAKNDEEFLAEASVVITPTSPFVSVYEDNPLYGMMFHQEVLGKFTLIGQEITFAAIPYFFNTPGMNSSAISYSWLTNEGSRETDNMVTYRITEGSSGISKVTLKTTHQDGLVQAGRNFLVQFGSNEQ